MCQFASGVMDKLHEYWDADSDSHSDIIRKHRLDDTKAPPEILKYELIPPNNGLDWDNLEKWEFFVDQDILPPWCNPVQDAARARAALKRRFPKGFKRGISVGGNLCLSSLTSLTVPVKAGGDLYLSSLTSLTVPVKAGGNLYLGSLTSLTVPVKAGGDLYLASCFGGELPKGTSVKGRVIR